MPRYDAAGLMGSGKIAERFAGLALTGLVVAACSSGGSAPPTQAIATTKRYELTFDVEMLDDGTLDVVANHTNLPEGTVVEVSATRSFVDAKGGSPTGVPVGRESTEVAMGAWAATVTLDESRLAVVGTAPDDAIQTVSPVIAVCAEVRTGVDSIDGTEHQWDDQARQELGALGENLEGSEGAFVFGEQTDAPATWLRVQHDVEVAPPLDEITGAQGSRPKVATIDTFCR